MKVAVIPLTDFIHDGFVAVGGRLIPQMDKALADELAKRNLVRITIAPRAKAPRVREFEDPGKVQAAGTEQLPSSSLAARVLPPTTAPTFKHGAQSGRHHARSSR